MTGRREPVADRIAKYTDHSAGPDGCWPWIGARTGSGYGILFVSRPRRRVRMASHLVYELARGYPPEKPCVLHTCDNPPCVNPRHLWSGTKGDNARDMEQKGRARHLRGEQHGRAKLTTVQVLELRGRYARGEALQRELAVEYGLAQAVVSKIVRRETWRHIG